MGALVIINLRIYGFHIMLFSFKKMTPESFSSRIYPITLSCIFFLASSFLHLLSCIFFLASSLLYFQESYLGNRQLLEIEI